MFQEKRVRVVTVNGVHGKYLAQAATLHEVVLKLVIGIGAHQVTVKELEVDVLDVRVFVEPVAQ